MFNFLAMDDLGLRSSDPLRPLQPLLSSVAENASNLAAAVKQQHDDEDDQHHLDVDVDARSLQPLQSAVAEFDHYGLHQHQHHPDAQSLRQEDPYSTLIVSERILNALPN